MLFIDSASFAWWLLVQTTEATIVQIISQSDNTLIYQPPTSQSDWKHSSGGCYSDNWRICLTFRKVGVMLTTKNMLQVVNLDPKIPEHSYASQPSVHLMDLNSTFFVSCFPSVPNKCPYDQKVFGSF